MFRDVHDDKFWSLQLGSWFYSSIIDKLPQLTNMLTTIHINSLYNTFDHTRGPLFLLESPNESYHMYNESNADSLYSNLLYLLFQTLARRRHQLCARIYILCINSLIISINPHWYYR